MAKKLTTVQFRFKTQSNCARDVGIKPGKSWTPQQRKKVSLCVARKLRSK